MKGSAITGPVGKEAAELWPVSYTLPSKIDAISNILIAYRLQLWCRHVNGLFLSGFWYGNDLGRSAFTAIGCCMRIRKIPYLNIEDN